MANLTYKGFTISSDNPELQLSTIKTSFYSVNTAISSLWASCSISTPDKSLILIQLNLGNNWYLSYNRKRGWFTGAYTISNYQLIPNLRKSIVYKGKILSFGGWSDSSNYTLILRTSDLSTWEKIQDAYTSGTASGTPRHLSNAAASDNTIVAIGRSYPSYLVEYSTDDGNTWTDVTSSFSSQTGIVADGLDTIEYGLGKFIVAGDSGKLAYSSNAINWNVIASPAPIGYGAGNITYVNNNFYVTYSKGNIFSKPDPILLYKSADGVNWTLHSTIPSSLSQSSTTNYYYPLDRLTKLSNALILSSSYQSTTDNTIPSIISYDNGVTWSTLPVNITGIILSQPTSNSLFIVNGDTSSSTVLYDITARYNYTVNPPTVSTTVSKNAPLNALEFDSNIKSLDSNKVDISGYTAADTLYADATGSIAKRAIGVDGSLLTPVSSSPVWALIDYSNATVQEYTTAGTFTWTKPIGVKMVYVYLMAGGGGGGGGAMYAGSSSNAVAFGGGGGGAGGVLETFIDPQSLSSTETIVVGAGGAGGTGAYQLGNLNSATSGTDGQNSSFSILNAIGGMSGEAGISIESPNAVYTIKGGGCGVIPLTGMFNQFQSASTIQADQYYSMGVGGFNVLDFSISGTLQYGTNNAHGKSGRNTSGGGGAGGCYVKLSGSAINVFAGDGGGGYRAGTYTSTTNMEAKNSDYLSLYTTPYAVGGASHNTFPVAGGAWANTTEGNTSSASGGGPGSGGPGGPSGGYTKSFSGSGAGALNYGGGGGGGGGCYALDGANSRAGNGGAGSRGRVVIACFF